MTLWFQLFLCLAVIGFAGWHLSRNGDIIAEKTGLSASWVGLVLLATATSLPELVTGLSAVTVADAPEIAVGDVLGSAVFNLLILVLLDALYRRQTLYSYAAQGHILSAALGALLLVFSAFSLLLEHRGFSPALAHVGAYTPLVVIIYLLAMRVIYRYEQHTVSDFVSHQADRYVSITLRRAIIGYAVAAGFIVAAGSWLPFVAKDLAELMGWGQSFVGTLLVAAITSAPEAAVTLSALRLGAVDMAIANLLGSNLFNMVILAIDDMAFARGPLLATVSEAHALTALLAAMMSTLVIIGLIFRPISRGLFGVTWISFGLFAFFLINTWVVFTLGH